MQTLNHAKCQKPFPSQDFIDTISAAYDRNKVFNGKALLLHSELDGFNRIWKTHWIVITFVSFNERYKYLQPIPFG